MKYEVIVMNSIDLYEEIKEELEKLVSSHNKMEFEKLNNDTYVAKMEYRGYSIRCKLHVKQLFEFCIETGKSASESIEFAIEQQIKEILCRVTENYF